jgi:hypothetical protein
MPGTLRPAGRFRNISGVEAFSNQPGVVTRLRNRPVSAATATARTEIASTPTPAHRPPSDDAVVAEGDGHRDDRRHPGNTGDAQRDPLDERQLGIVGHRRRRCAVVAHQVLDPSDRRRESQHHDRSPDQHDRRQPQRRRRGEVGAGAELCDDRITGVHGEGGRQEGQQRLDVAQHEPAELQHVAGHAVLELGDLLEQRA